MGTEKTIKNREQDRQEKAKAFIDSLKLFTDAERAILMSAFEVGYVAGSNHERFGS